MAAPRAPVLATQVELFVSASGLPCLDLTSETDAFFELFSISPAPAKSMTQIERSEVVENSAAPRWAKQLLLEYRFEEVQSFLIRVWDYDAMKSHDFVGEAEFTLGRVMGARGTTLSLPLMRKGAKSGAITIRGAEVRSVSRDLLRVQFRASSLDKKDWFGSSDPFIVVSRPRSDGSAMKVWESSVIKNNLNPVWPVVDVPIQTLCNADLMQPLIFEVFDWDSDGSHDLIGVANASVNDLLAAPTSARAFPLIHPKKPGKKGNNGILAVSSAMVIRQPSFLEYITGGCQLNLCVSIDFTGSNGDPRTPSSLHYINPAAPNEYLQAITAVSSILIEYDYDKMVPAFGYGGSINGGPTNHCFALTFNEASPEVAGVDGIVAAYKNAFSYVGLSGPTYFQPTIARVAEMASVGVTQASQRYTVLLVITDGQMNDLDATVAQIVDASALPLSIVIVGVGGADFSSMEILDADRGALTAGTRRAARDIVQFVPFRKFVAAGVGAGSLLAKEVLKEIPAQLVSFFTSRGIVPNAAPPPPAPVAAGPPPLMPGSAPMAAAASAPPAAGGMYPSAPFAQPTAPPGVAPGASVGRV